MSVRTDVVPPGLPWAYASYVQRKRKRDLIEREGRFRGHRTPVFVGLSALPIGKTIFAIAFAVRDRYCLLDSAVSRVHVQAGARLDMLTSFFIKNLQSFEEYNFCKVVGAGVPGTLESRCPRLCVALWREMDAFPIVFDTFDLGNMGTKWNKHLDEQANSMARKCIS